MESQTVGHKYARGSVSGVIEDCAVRAVLLTGERASKTNMTEEMCAYCAYETRDGSENYNSVRMISCYVGMKRTLMVTWTSFERLVSTNLLDIFL